MKKPIAKIGNLTLGDLVMNVRSLRKFIHEASKRQHEVIFNCKNNNSFTFLPFRIPPLDFKSEFDGLLIGCDDEDFMGAGEFLVHVHRLEINGDDNVIRLTKLDDVTDDPISMREFSLNDIKSLCSFKSDFVEETEDV